MKARALPLLAGTMVLCLAVQSATPAGEKDFPVPKPGPEHKILAKLAGSWNCKTKMWLGPGDPKESTGTATRKMILEGRYLHETFQGDFLGKKFQGFGVTGYDVNQKKYVSAWIDNFGTGITTSHGSYDPDSKTFTYKGEEFDPSGGKMKLRDVLKFVSDDEQVLEMYRTPADGKEMKMMEITCTRAAK